MKKINFLLLGLVVLLFSSCLKDTGNYKYNPGGAIRVTHPTYSYTVFLNDVLTVDAIRQFSNGSDSLDFQNAWYINGEFYSDEPQLKFKPQALGTYRGQYYAIDKTTGVYTAAISGFNITVTSPFATGWVVLYNKNNNSEIAHISVNSGVYKDFTDLYSSSNDGDQLGSQPVGLNDFGVTGGKRGLFVLQHGGQGSVELSGDDYKLQLVTNNTFAGGVAPANFKPVDIGLFATSDMMVNDNGDVYPRYFNNPVPFTTPWLSLPMQTQGGMKISDIWKSWNALTYAYMHDKLNNRILYVRLDAPNVTGGIAVIDTFPNPIIPPGIVVPVDYVYPNHLGQVEYIWGGTFHDAMYNGDGAFLFKDPADQKIYFETFLSKSVNRTLEWSPQFKMEFPGASVLNDDSKFVALKSRDYLFFTGGTNNSDLYYFDILTKTVIKLFKQLPGKVSVLTASDDNNQLAVGLDDGTFILYDVSDQTIINGAPVELHRLSGLGQVVDIVVKGSQMN